MILMTLFKTFWEILATRLDDPGLTIFTLKGTHQSFQILNSGNVGLIKLLRNVFWTHQIKLLQVSLFFLTLMQ
jgi:hypothetical protein